MLSKLSITNFRCFENHRIDFRRFNIIVGKNNVGKSTIVDALKLLANVCRYASHRDGYLQERDIPFPQVNLRYNYEEKDTIIRADLADEISIEIVFPVENKIEEGRKEHWYAHVSGKFC